MSIPGRRLSDQRTSALTAGTVLMIMTLAAFFSYGFAHAHLLVQGDANATLQNMIAQNNLFKAEILGWIIILICDIVVAWSCYVFLKPIHPHLSLLGAWLRLTYATILGIAIMNLLFVQLLSNSTNDLSGFTSNQLGVQVMLHLKAFDSMWSVGLLVFGGHLLILGMLTLRSDSVPKCIGILLLIASVGYILIHLGKLFFADYEGTGRILEFVFIVPMTAGELCFGLWMLFRGGKVTAQA
jgi:magnesium-transporting ATPase (P-type)